MYQKFGAVAVDSIANDHKVVAGLGCICGKEKEYQGSKEVIV